MTKCSKIYEVHPSHSELLTSLETWTVGWSASGNYATISVSQDVACTLVILQRKTPWGMRADNPSTQIPKTVNKQCLTHKLVINRWQLPQINMWSFLRNPDHYIEENMAKV